MGSTLANTKGKKLCKALILNKNLNLKDNSSISLNHTKRETTKLNTNVSNNLHLENKVFLFIPRNNYEISPNIHSPFANNDGNIYFTIKFTTLNNLILETKQALYPPLKNGKKFNLKTYKNFNPNLKKNYNIDNNLKIMDELIEMK